MAISKASRAARKRVGDRIKASKGDIKAVADYLEANGWSVVVIGPGRIEQDLGARKFQYRFVVHFTGSKRDDAKAGTHG